MAYETRPWRPADLDDLLALVAGNAARRAPGLTELGTSDIVWQWPGSQPERNVRLWRDDTGLAGFAWFQPPDTLLFDAQVDVDEPQPLFAAMVEWAVERRSSFPAGYPRLIDLESMADWAEMIRSPRPHPLDADRYLVTAALEDDHERLEVLGEAGFVATDHFQPALLRSLDLPLAVDPPPGFVLRHVEATELEERVAVHRAAWAPAAGFNLDTYLAVRAIRQVFDPELDIVAQADDGRFASYTIAWADPVSRIGSFEPFGTRPEFRGTGVSEAVIGEGLRRLAARGMRWARLTTAGFNGPAARLYERCGFRRIGTLRTYLKRL